MKRAAKHLLILLVVGAIVAGLGWVGLVIAERRATLLTDGATIRTLERDEAPREIMWTPPARLGSAINTTGDDYEPRISADGQTLLFVRGKAGRNADIYIAHRTRTGWGDPAPLEGVNSDADDLGPELSADGSSLYFYSNRTGGMGGYDLWIARRENDGSWGEPVNLGPNVNSDHHDYGPALTPGAEHLYFASNRPKPTEPLDPNADTWSATVREDLFKRDYDLYLAEMEDGEPGLARPLSAVNTSANEGTPSISPSGDFLLFASDREGGQGGFDLFRARRLDGGHWPAENLGPSINTRANELDPAPSMGGFALHFSSDRPHESLEEAGEPIGPNYDLFVSQSREVFRTIDRQELDVDWAGLWALIGPWLLWLLLLLLLLLLALLALRDGRLKDRWGKLGLLARCILLSLLLHALLLAMLAAWEVSTALGDYLRNPGGTKVALISRSSGDGIASQIRGQLTSFELEFAPSTDAVRRETDPIRPARAAAARLDLAQMTRPEASRLEQAEQTREAQAPDTELQRELSEAQEVAQSEESSVEVPESTPSAPQPEARVAVEAGDAPDPLANERAIEINRAAAAQAALEPQQDDPPRPRPMERITRADDVIAIDQAMAPSVLAAPSQTPTFHAPDTSLATPRSAARATQRERTNAVPTEQFQASTRATQELADASRADAVQAAIAPNELSRRPDPGPLADQSPLADAASGLVPSQLAGGTAPRIDVPPTIAEGDLSMPAGSPGASHEEGSLSMPRAAPLQASRPERAAPSSSTSATRADVETMELDLPTGQSSVSTARATSSDAAPSSIDAPLAASDGALDVEIDSVVASVMAMPEARQFEAPEPIAALPPAQSDASDVRASPNTTMSQVNREPTSIELGPAHDLPEHPAGPTLAQATQARDSSAAPSATPAVRSPGALELSKVEMPSVSVPSDQSASEQVERNVDLPRAALPVDRLARTDSADQLNAPTTTQQAAVNPASSAARPQTDTSLSPEGHALAGEVELRDSLSARSGQLAIDLDVVPAGEISLPSAQTTAWSDEETATDSGASMEMAPARAAIDSSASSTPAANALASIAPAPDALGGAPGVIDPGAMDLVVDSRAPIDTSSDVSQLRLPGAPALTLVMPEFKLPEEPEPELYPQRDPEIREQLVEEGGGSVETEEAMESALAWLAARQSEDGSWTGQDIPDEAGGDPAAFEFSTALTGLSLLCFLGAGHTHLEDGPYQDVVIRSLEWMINQVSASGDLRTGETLYSQGIGTIALAEAYGMTRDPRLRELTERAVLFIARSRNTGDRGGWRYEPGQEGDTSVLGWQVMAMISARRAGIDVPDDALEAAGTWLEIVTRPEQPGLYAYKPGRRATVSMTAEALYIRQILGEPRDAIGMEDSASHVLRSLPDWDDEPNTYFWYYATLAMYQHSGPAWERWNEAMVRELIDHQRDDGAAAGSWDPTDRWAEIGGRVYQTAICALMLEVYYRYLPLYVIERVEADDDSR